MMYSHLFKLGIIEHLVVACPNINELHVEVDGLAETCVNIDFSQFFSAVQFQHLTRLTITGQTLRDGSYLPSVFIRFYVLFTYY